MGYFFLFTLNNEDTIQARTQPKIYGGAKLIFQDLYVYIFATLKKFLA